MIRKEAQRCYCMAPKCRGWIGGDNDKEEEDEEEEEEDEIEEDVEEEEENVERKVVKVKARKVQRKRRKDTTLEDISVMKLKLQIIRYAS